MKRLALLGALAACGAMLIAAPGAASASEVPNIERTCTTTSKNVITDNVKGIVFGKFVDPSQAKYAKCPTVKKVMHRMLTFRYEEPKVFEGFRCTPTVTHVEPDVVNYRCVFKGADTATFIRVTFTAKYDQD